MQATVRAFTRGASLEAGQAAAASQPELECRVSELETENSRLRLLVGELLIANQRLRERATAVHAK